MHVTQMLTTVAALPPRIAKHEYSSRILVFALVLAEQRADALHAARLAPHLRRPRLRFVLRRPHARHLLCIQLCMRSRIPREQAQALGLVLSYPQERSIRGSSRRKLRTLARLAWFGCASWRSSAFTGFSGWHSALSAPIKLPMSDHASCLAIQCLRGMEQLIGKESQISCQLPWSHALTREVELVDGYFLLQK